jgi:hypothetical protein
MQINNLRKPGGHNIVLRNLSSVREKTVQNKLV